MSKLVQGIGFNNNKYPSWKNGKRLKEYRLWQDMLLRCTKGFWSKHPTYVGTTCSENFKHYSYFYEWCQEQTGFNCADDKRKCWQLDKDILVDSNKLYSEDTCVFVPARVNLLLTKRDAMRGYLPIGVRWHKRDKKYESNCNDRDGKLKHLGYFHSVQEAFLAYKTFKESLIKEVANEYREQLAERAYEALMKYEVNIDD